MIEQLKWQRKHYSVEAEGNTVVMGWVREIRKMGNLIFIQLADREGTIQITIKKGNKLLDKFSKLGKEDVIAVKGKVEKNKEAPSGKEVIPSDMQVLSKSESPLPLEVRTKAHAELETRLDNRVLDLRKPEIQAVFKIQVALINGMEELLIKNRFLKVFTPCLMGATSESGAEMFEIPYFEKKAYLRQDPQLHRQLLIGGGFDRIFDTGPSWRAETSHTIRHLCEHRGCAVELAFIKDETDTMRIEEQVVVAGIKNANKLCKAELEILGKKINVPKLPFPELRFPDLYNILSEYGKKVKFGDDIDREAEKILAEHAQKKFKADFFFINHFPFSHKPFYVMKNDDIWARSVDLEAKGGIELSSGGQREHRYEQLMKNIKERKTNPESVEWFTRFFKYGFPPHGGFCIGLERLTQVVLDLPNVREAVLFPRDPERLVP